jgi:hypothetical protein
MGVWGFFFLPLSIAEGLASTLCVSFCCHPLGPGDTQAGPRFAYTVSALYQADPEMRTLIYLLPGDWGAQ